MESAFIPQRWDNYNRGVSYNNFKGALLRAGGAAIVANYLGRRNNMPNLRRVYSRKRTRSGTIKFRPSRPSLRMARRGKGMTSGRGVTFEHDRQFIYKKKRMPRFKKRRWKRFVKNVQFMGAKSLGTRTVVFNSQYTNFTATYVFQLATDVNLYSGQSADLWRNDINNIGLL